MIYVKCLVCLVLGVTERWGEYGFYLLGVFSRGIGIDSNSYV